MVPYEVLEWLSKRGLTPNELRVWLEEMMRTDVNLQKRILGVILRILNGDGTDGPKRQEKKCPDHGGGTSHCHRQKNWKWADQILDAALGTRSTRYLVTDRGGTS